MTNEDLLKKSREDYEAIAKTTSAFREDLGRLLNSSEAGSAEAAKDEMLYKLHAGFNYIGEHLIRQIGVDRAREIFEQMSSRRIVG